jgi:hypothetical protein
MVDDEVEDLWREGGRHRGLHQGTLVSMSIDWDAVASATSIWFKSRCDSRASCCKDWACSGTTLSRSGIPSDSFACGVDSSFSRRSMICCFFNVILATFMSSTTLQPSHAFRSGRKSDHRDHPPRVQPQTQESCTRAQCRSPDNLNIILLRKRSFLTGKSGHIDPKTWFDQRRVPGRDRGSWPGGRRRIRAVTVDQQPKILSPKRTSGRTRGLKSALRAITGPAVADPTYHVHFHHRSRVSHTSAFKHNQEIPKRCDFWREVRLEQRNPSRRKTEI